MKPKDLQIFCLSLTCFLELFQDLSQLQETWLAEGKAKKKNCFKRRGKATLEGGKKSPELAVLMFSPIN